MTELSQKRFLVHRPRIIRALWIPALWLSVAAVASTNDFTYSTNSSPIKTLTITGYTGPGGAVTIPSTISSQTVTCIGSSAFSYNTNITSVVIPNGVTNIANNAFPACANITNVSISTSVTYIGSSAFYSNSSLLTITIPNGVLVLGDYAFFSCSQLTNVVLGKGVTNIGNWTFYECPSLAAFSVNPTNSKYSSVSNVLFNTNKTILVQCPPGKAGSYAIPSTVTNISGAAFYACTNLTGITMTGNKVTNIGTYAFAYCSSLASLTIPASTTNIGIYAFIQCGSLATLNVDSSNAMYSSTNGVLFNKSQTTLIQCPGGKAAAYSVPDTVKVLGIGAFFSCSNLTSITMSGNAITNIGSFNFGFCSRLTSLTIPGTVTNIGSETFEECPNLVGVYFKRNSPVVASTSFYNSPNVIVYYLPGTTGWSSTCASRPTALWQPQVPGDASLGIQTNQFGFNINWASGMVVIVEATTSLSDTNWIPLQSNTLTSDTLYFSDSNWTAYPHRLYRARMP